LVLETAGQIGTATSSRNSEVIHSGIYYSPGSLKARLCVAGRTRLYAYCHERGVPHRQVGKLILATTESDVAILHRYRQLADANGVGDLPWLSTEDVRQLEPAVECVRAIHSPLTGIVDTHTLMLAFQGDLESAGGQVIFRSPLMGASVHPDGFELQVGGSAETTLVCRELVNCAGLAAPTVARGIKGMSHQSVPRERFAKGHYYSLSGRSPFGRLVYPVAETAGLGIHVTLDLGGHARFGPDVQWIDSIDYSFDESRRPTFIEAILRYYPDLDPTRLQADYTGIRPKISGPDEPAADFRIDGPETHGTPGLVNLMGIESPGLTASIAIGAYVLSIFEDGEAARPALRYAT
jgi:L-2-hydroxyglutarate oxidase LhgO